MSKPNQSVCNEALRQWDPAFSRGIALLSDDTDDEELFIPLKIKRLVSYFDSRKPTEEELRTCPRVVSPADTPWDPNTTTYDNVEDAVNSANPGEVSAMTITDDEYDMYGDCRIQRLQQIVTAQNLTNCSIAADCKLYHRLSAVHRIFSTSRDKLVESGSVMSSGDRRRNEKQ